MAFAALAGVGCAATPPDPAPPHRAAITFELDAFRDDGLLGPPDGLVTVDYECCVPDDPDALAAAEAADPSIRWMKGSRGRIGCGPGEVLGIGSTHPLPDWRGRLEALAALPFVHRIDRTWYE